MKFGAHMSASGGVWKALQRGRSIQCEIIQVFVKNNMQWFGKPFSPETLALYANELAANSFACVFGHAGYLINLGAPASENRDRSIQSLAQEIQLAAQLELPFLVLHPGAHLGAGETAGLKQIAAGLDAVCAATRFQLALWPHSNMTMRIPTSRWNLISVSPRGQLGVRAH